LAIPAALIALQDSELSERLARVTAKGPTASIIDKLSSSQAMLSHWLRYIDLNLNTVSNREVDRTVICSRELELQASDSLHLGVMDWVSNNKETLMGSLAPLSPVFLYVWV
jgi:hypothetical protein